MPSSDTSLALETIAKFRHSGRQIHAFDQRPATPATARREVRSSLGQSWVSGYVNAAGLPRLRQAIASRTSSAWPFPIVAEEHILVTAGAREAIYCFMLACLDPGDEIVVPEPCWPGYAPCIAAAGGRMITVPTAPSPGFAIDIERLRECLTPSTRAIVLNTPHNPTGMVIPLATLEAIASLASERQLPVLVDESYESAVFDGAVHRSLAALPDMFPLTVTVSSVSKLHGMPGWRVGWAIGNASVIERMLAFHRGIVGCVSPVAQLAAAAVLEGGQETVLRARRQLERRRNWALHALLRIPGIQCPKPEGAFFLFPDIRSFGLPSAALAERLVHQAGVQVVAGSAFGAAGEGHVRVGFNTSWDDLRHGMDALDAALRSWQ